MKINITYIISNIDKAIAFEWIADEINKNLFNLSFILLNNAENCHLEKHLKQQNIPVFFVEYQGKKSIFSVFWKVRKLLKTLKTQIVHTHLFDACLIGLFAAKTLGIKKRIHTRHHSSFHHEYFPKGVYYDKFNNYLSTNIIAISSNVRNILVDWEKVQPEKVSIIHHGFKLEEFENIKDISKDIFNQKRIQTLKNKYNPKNNAPVIGVISRYTLLKGLQYIIPAFKKLLQTYPNAHLILANANGDYKNEVKKFLTEIPVENYTEILFENDIVALYQLFDMHIHTPINAHAEAFGQTYIEALISKIPSIFTISGVANNFIKHEKNALVVPYEDKNAIYEAMIRLLEDKNLVETLKNNGFEDVKKDFNLETYINKLENLYQ